MRRTTGFFFPLARRSGEGRGEGEKQPAGDQAQRQQEDRVEIHEHEGAGQGGQPRGDHGAAKPQAQQRPRRHLSITNTTPPTSLSKQASQPAKECQERQGGGGSTMDPQYEGRRSSRFPLDDMRHSWATATGRKASTISSPRHRVTSSAGRSAGSRRSTDPAAEALVRHSNMHSHSSTPGERGCCG